MDVNLILGIVLGGIAAFFFFLLMTVVIWLFWIMHQAKYNRLIRIKNITAGKPVAEFYKGRFIKHPKLGDCYEVPKLRREGRQFIQFFGSTYEYPTNKSRVKFVPVTFYNNVYAPEKYEWSQEIEIEAIEKNGRKYEKVIKKVYQPIVTPLKSSMRQFNLAADKAIEEEYNVPVGWFERNKAVILSLGMIFLTVVLCIMLIVFTYQSAADGLFSRAPEWVQPILDALSQNQAPPSTPLAP